MEVLETTLAFGTRFLSLFNRKVKHNGREMDWVFASRSKDGNTEKPDAVFIVALYDDNGTPKLVLTSEFRVPLNGREISFPAGIIEEGQSYTDAAVRELKEETGLDLDVSAISPRIFSSAGMTDESCVIVFGIATGTPSNEFLEESEDIEVVLADVQKIREFVAPSPYNMSAKTWPLLFHYSICGLETFFDDLVMDHGI